MCSVIGLGSISGRLSGVFGLLRVCQQTLGLSTDSAVFFFPPQIRFFAKTYTLTPYNGAEAHVSSSQLDILIFLPSG